MSLGLRFDHVCTERMWNSGCHREDSNFYLRHSICVVYITKYLSVAIITANILYIQILKAPTNAHFHWYVIHS
jgi:hypothetical protein